MQQSSYTSALSLPSLRSALTGRVVAPDDPGYDELRTLFMGNFDRRPTVIVRPANAADVAKAIGFARDNNLPLAIRNGGHSSVGHSCVDDAIVLDLRDLRAFEIDADQRTVWADAGLSAAELTKATGAHGLAIGFGDTGSVGISGITLGGGIGYLTRKYGLTIDSLLAAEIVTANGERLHVDAESHPDLFWAIRGGGGNFGVVTRFKYRLHPVDQVVGGPLMLPATVETVVRAIELCEQAPEELSAIVNVMSAPPMPFIPAEWRGKLVVMLLMCYAGDAEAGAQVIAPFRALGQPIMDMVRPIKYPEVYPPDDPTYHPKATGRTMFLNKVDTAVATTILESLQRSDAPMRVAQLRVLGGAMARVPADATAFAHRDGKIMTNVAAFFAGPEDRPARDAWAAEFAAALDQGYPGAYVNFVFQEGESHVRKAYPSATYDRLAAVKARYDPHNLFRLNHNIPPRAH